MFELNGARGGKNEAMNKLKISLQSKKPARSWTRRAISVKGERSKHATKLEHWEPLAESNIKKSSGQYNFLTLDKHVRVPTIKSVGEYENFYKKDGWDYAETVYFLDLCRRFELKMLVVYEFYEVYNHKNRTVEELNQRFSEIEVIHANLTNEKVENGRYDMKADLERKVLLNEHLNKSAMQIAEDEYLLMEFKRILNKRKERSKQLVEENAILKQAELIELNSYDKTCNFNEDKEVECEKESVIIQVEDEVVPNNNNNSVKKKNVKNTKSIKRRDISVYEGVTDVTPMEKFQLNKAEMYRNPGVYLKSQKLKTIQTFNAKKTRLLETVLSELAVDEKLIVLDEVYEKFFNLRANIVLLCNLKNAYGNLLYDYFVLKHIKENPDKNIDDLLPNDELKRNLLVDPILNFTGKRKEAHSSSLNSINEIVNLSINSSRKRR